MAIRHLGLSSGRPGLRPASGRFALSGTYAVADPYAAHVARLQAIDPSGSYYTARDYTASVNQAGLFVDAFGGALTYTSPNVMASPTRVVDATSGLAYVSSDGADDTAIGSAAETVDTYIAVFRAPQSTFSSYASIIESTYTGDYAGYFAKGGTGFQGGPRAVRRNGVALSSATDSLAPINVWQVLTVAAGHPTVARALMLTALGNVNFLSLHLAEIRKWSTTPSAAIVAATEQEMMSYYGPLIANGAN